MLRFVDELVKARKAKSLVLIASLPRNDVRLAKIALGAGADAVKIHINVHHHASNTHFGNLAEERGNLEAILKIWKGKLTGIMPYAAPVNDPETFITLADMGFDFYSQYLSHAIPGCISSLERVARMWALAVGDPFELASGLDNMPMQVCELSILDGDTYGQPFTYHDIALYAAIRTKTNLPLVVPSQHLITPESVPDLIHIGVEGLMIGAVVAGETEDSWLRCMRAFRKAIDRY